MLVLSLDSISNIRLDFGDMFWNYSLKFDMFWNYSLWFNCLKECSLKSQTATPASNRTIWHQLAQWDNSTGHLLENTSHEWCHKPEWVSHYTACSIHILDLTQKIPACPKHRQGPSIAYWPSMFSMPLTLVI